jgi:protein involved in polysaccharide export with SLBB domain
MKQLFLLLVALFCLPLHSALSQSEIALRSGDKVTIAIGGIPPDEVVQINNIYQVDGAGFISLLHLGQVKAAGVTASSLGSKIMQQYREKEIYTNPNVVVNTEIGQGGGGRVVYVDGYVNRPGKVDFRPGLTASNAIAEAGGKTAFGKLSRVRLTRVVDGKTQIYTLDLTEPGNAASQTQLLPNDTLSVPN